MRNKTKRTKKKDAKKIRSISFANIPFHVEVDIQFNGIMRGMNLQLIVHFWKCASFDSILPLSLLIPILCIMDRLKKHLICRGNS